MKIENTFHQASIPLCTAHLEKAAYHVCAHLHLSTVQKNKAFYLNEIGINMI